MMTLTIKEFHGPVLYHGYDYLGKLERDDLLIEGYGKKSRIVSVQKEKENRLILISYKL